MYNVTVRSSTLEYVAYSIIHHACHLEIRRRISQILSKKETKTARRTPVPVAIISSLTYTDITQISQISHSWFVFAAGLLREFKDGSEDACRNPESQGTFIEEIEDNRHCRHRHRRLRSHLQSTGFCKDST